MPTSTSAPTRSTRSIQSIITSLSRSLKKAFSEICPERYGDGCLRLQRVDDDSDPQQATFEVEGPDPASVDIELAVSHVGGNVYDIRSQVEDGPRRRFTYSDPHTSSSSVSLAPHLAKKIAKKVLNDVERCLGKQVLRRQIPLDSSATVAG